MHKDRNRKPPCIVNTIERHENVHEYVIKSKQFLESNGIVTITEPNGITLVKAVVSGREKMKDVTAIIKLILKQNECPCDSITIDTGLLNRYTDGDIECGTQKIIEIEYMTNDHVTENKKVRQIKECDI